MISKYKILCPKCKKNNIKKRGIRKTGRGKIQRYYCKSCKYSFVEDNGFYRMRNDQKKITLCLDLFFRGVSLRKVQEHLQAFYPQNSSHMTIYRWVVKYSRLISNFTNKLKLNVGIEAQTDELEFHRRKSHNRKAGTEKNWFIDSICPKTKFMLSSEYMKTRGAEHIKVVIERIKARTGKQIKIYDY